MDRVTYIIDGFNLYHSVRQAAREQENEVSTKWLDIRALCRSYLHLLGRDARLSEVYYFSALAQHIEARKPEVTKRHRALIQCLESTGVRVELSRFKKKPFRCANCGTKSKTYEEKETDVAIAAKVFELLVDDACDTVVLVTGDTDLAPAVRTAKRLFPSKRLLFAFPYRRKNKELQKLAPNSFHIDRKQYAKHQLPDPFVLENGLEVHKPQGW